MSTITIKGEAGKSLNEDERQFSEIAESGSLSFGSLRVDELSFSMVPADTTGSDLTPDEGQELSLLIGGEVAFKGIAATVSSQWRESSLATQVKVSGAWWWLEQTPLSELIEEVERPQFRCGKGDVKSHIQSLFARLEALGVPVALGEVIECYEIPTVTFRDGPFSSALAELIRYVPDAVGWWDYSKEVPEFNLSRRSVDNATQFVLGSDPVISADLQAEYGLEVKTVEVPYAERLPSGETAFRTQTSQQGEAGSRQVNPVSGPELADFVPSDPIEGATITTVDAMANSVTVDVSAIEQIWGFWVDWAARNSAISATRNLSLWDESTGLSSTFYPGGLEPFIELADGTALDVAVHNRYAVIYDPETEIPDWMSEIENVQKAKLKGTVWFLEENSTGTPDWIKELIQESSFERKQVGGTGQPAGQNNNDHSIFFDLDLDIVLIDRVISAETLYKPLSYIYETPPNDYAENLRAAQSWLPYSGDIVLQAPEGPLKRYSGQTINLSGGREKWQQMGALAQGESIDLYSGQHSIELGLPSRLSGVTPVTRLDRDPKDNVITL